MCVICLKKPDATVLYEELEKMWASNKDGAGYAFTHDGKIQLRKGFMKFKKLMGSIKQDVDKYDIGNKLVLLHFRIGSLGSLSAANTHPFAVTDDIVMAHNGTLSGLDSKLWQGKSDTALLSKLLGGLPKEWITSTGIRNIVERYSKPSKLVFLLSDNQYYITNEAAGTWDNGRWFSNTYWRNNAVVYTTPKYYCGHNSHARHEDYWDERYDERYDDHPPAGDKTKEVIAAEEDVYKCDGCESLFYLPDISKIGAYQFCDVCCDTMTDEEMRLYEDSAEKVIKNFKAKDKKYVECPVCKIQILADKEDFDAVWCADCSIFYNDKGHIVTY